MMLNKKSVFIIVCFILMNAVVFALMSPTIQQKGRWESLSSFLVCEAKINDKSERVCLPRLIFDDAVEMDTLFSQVQEGLKAQDAIFQLYHDGLGSPKKQNGMFFASDVFLKDLDMTYTGYLRSLGYNFTLSNKPAYEDDEYMGEVLVGESANDMVRSVKKAEKEKREKEAKKEKPGSKSNLRVTTVYDMLPEGVIPPSIRSQQLKIAAIVNNLKNRPYETEIIQIDPLRWASGYMGQLNEKGEIDMAKVEGQVVDLLIRVPNKEGWLTKEMQDELKNTPCEYVITRYKNGNEVVEGTRYLLHDIYFGKLKLTWKEWLEKHGQQCPDFVEKPEYAAGVVPIELHPIKGVFRSLDALVISQINFTEKTNLVFPQEIIRIFPPNPKPNKKQMRKFVKAFNEACAGKNVTAHIMVCPDGKSYTELGQKRAKKIIFTDTQRTLENLQETILNSLKEEK